MLKVSHISKSYGTLKVLDDVSLDIKQGELVSIVGASGAGKTTLLQIIGTLDHPDAGSILYDDVDITHLNEKDLSAFRNKHIGFVFQFHNLLPEFTAVENVCLPALIAGCSMKQAHDEAMQLLQFLNVDARANHKPSQLSGGEQQRVAVARALINQPSVVLADEPSGNLDSHNARDLHNLFFSLRQKFNQSFIIVTHNEELASLADRTITLKDGKKL